MDARAQLVGPLDPLDVLLQHQILGRLLKALVCEPATVRLAPAGARVAPPMAQQEALELLPRPPLVTLGQRPHAHQVAHRLMGLVGHPDLDQMTGAQVLRQGHRIAPIGLHPITGLAGDQRRGDHVAAVPEAA